MDCDRVAESLPWFINQTLQAAECRELEAHLAGCARCQAEVRETRAAFAFFFGPHVPVWDLVDFALGGLGPRGRWEFVKRHLSSCLDCTEQLGMVRQSLEALHSLETPSDGAPSRQASVPGAQNGTRSKVPILDPELGETRYAVFLDPGSPRDGILTLRLYRPGDEERMDTYLIRIF